MYQYDPNSSDTAVCDTIYACAHCGNEIPQHGNCETCEMPERITLVGSATTLASALDTYINQELDAQAEYAARGDSVLETICSNNVTSATQLQEQIIESLKRCEAHLTPGCTDPLPHQTCTL